MLVTLTEESTSSSALSVLDSALDGLDITFDLAPTSSQTADGAALDSVSSTPLPLRGAHSVRDLGGYPCVDARGRRTVTATGAFLRSGSLFFLTAGEVQLLKAYGVTRVIDLRSPMELRFFPDSFCRGKHGDISYVSVPMMDRFEGRGIRGKIPAHMSDVYCAMLDDDADSIGAVFEALDTEGCVLFHCRQGKDRTGVIAMLLLKLAGASDETVVRDYALSDRYTGRTMGLQRVGLTILARRSTRCVFKSDPDEMVRTLAHLEERYGTVRRYLEEAAEVPATTLNRLAARLNGCTAGC